MLPKVHEPFPCGECLLIAISGYQVYTTNLGYETPCYTMPSVTLEPGTTPSIKDLTVITQYVFARKYLLHDPTAAPPKHLSNGAILGIAIGIPVNVLFFLFLILLCLRRRARARKEAETQRKAAFIPRSQEMDEPHDITRPSELASPQSNPVTPHTASSGRSPVANWPMGPGSPPPPTYDAGSGFRPPPAPAKMTIPQELPGSTFIYEHHPAMQPEQEKRQEPNERAVSSVAPTEPRTPTRHSEPVSPPMSSPPLVVSLMLSPAK